MSNGRLRALVVLLAVFGLEGCTERNTVTRLQSLSGSEDTVMLCRDENGVGHPFADCPDRDQSDDDDNSKKLSVIALVSQTITNEVAVVDVSEGHVVDVDPVRPGYGFLRVGGRPVSMAATPGGRAAFVATADVGRHGIFALPTACLSAPAEGELERDLTTWPACRLDEAPGELTVLIEPFADAPPTSPDATEDGAHHCRVDGYEDDDGEAADSPLSSNQCQGDLRDEAGGVGRRKLVVALPDSGELGVLDAQELLNTPAGTFPRCRFERRIPLKVDVPAGVAQALPPDLTGNLLDGSASCSEVSAPVAPTPPPSPPQPAGFAQADGQLYIADRSAPVVHVMDTSSVCGMVELPSLLPMSLREPLRVVKTERLAVSPLTPRGQRFVYAIDAEDQPGASVMVFDVSPGSTDRTPLVRPGSPELPNEKPDRLSLGSSAKDITFAYRDIPYVDTANGVGRFGDRCNPDPAADLSSPGALARSADSYGGGARPGLLRGLFGFVLLTNGSIAVVDVDDFDADCRRPRSTNASLVPDFRGCANDTLEGPLVLPDGSLTVTDEVSCRVVQPHRFRGSRFALNNDTVGVRAPALRELPQLTLPSVAAASAVVDRPRLLAVPYQDEEGRALAADVYVGSTRLSTDPSLGEAVAVQPNARGSEQLQVQNGLVLPPLEPRSYGTDDTFTLTYEGAYASASAGFLDESGTLRDASLSFCAAGVYDVATMKDYAQRDLGVGEADRAEAFARAHTDFVQLVTPLLPADDGYWKYADVTRSDCLAKFGPDDAEVLSKARDFRIESAFAGELRLALPEVVDAPDWKLVTQCFPTPQRYRLRVGRHWALIQGSAGFRHDVVASGADKQCIRSCNPLRKWAKARVFELSSEEEAADGTPHCRRSVTDNVDAVGDPLELRVGCKTELDVACVYDQLGPNNPGGAVSFDEPAAACIFNGLNARFALYRGRQPSERDSVFTWRTSGGFSPLTMGLNSLSTVVSPQTIQFLQQPELLAVVDGASQGLSFFSLDTFSVAKPSPFY